jgi:hypothetical protein
VFLPAALRCVLNSKSTMNMRDGEGIVSEAIIQQSCVSATLLLEIDDNLVSSSHHCATLSKHQNGDKDIRTLLPAALLSEIDNQSMKWRGDGSKSFYPR